ncbi:hypothetical protein [Streptomyces sp. NBC_01618]|uniref:hypothetical protein n=1 Tax=Streptomyces sp. NBC_01618 TaxID=2975900 RepID=UPI00386C5901|nr:hypothetical protein OH735_37805 [Streptomyces sp. NBC_01618]
MRLAERCGLSGLVTQKEKLSKATNGTGASADAKVSSIVAGMAAGADSIDDLHVLRHGAMPAVFTGIRAPSTLGTFLRSFTHGHALQLHAVYRRFLAALAAHTPLLPGAGEKTFIDVDSTHKRVYGRAKQGAEYGRFTGAVDRGQPPVPVESTLSVPCGDRTAYSREQRLLVLNQPAPFWQRRQRACQATRRRGCGRARDSWSEPRADLYGDRCNSRAGSGS